MNDNDIIKAMERCNNPILTCEGCPLERVCSCMSVIRKDAFDIINRQKAEIERLKYMVAQNEGVLPEYERLIKAEAIKEFAERLKDTRVDLGGIEMVAVGNIDTISKEMTEETL